MTANFGPTDDQVERLAEKMHGAQLGCVIGDWAKEDGSFGHSCIADHKEQASILFQAMIHDHL